MADLGKDVSLWMETSDDPAFPKFSGSGEADVAIVGAGIVGLTAAYRLKQAGLTVAVFEKDTVGSGVTGHTTGKVSSLHGTGYTHIVDEAGRAAARAYGEANERAIWDVEEIIKKENIDCDWARDDNYVYTEDADEVDTIKREAAEAKEAGLPASLVDETPLPYAIRAAVRVTNQAKFHSRKYLLGLARAVHEGGASIFEQTRVLAFSDGRPCRLKTAGGTFRAKHVIEATNVPFRPTTRGWFCTKEYPRRSYIVAAPLWKPLEGMYITAGSPLRSILPITVGGTDYLLVGGESHLPGMGGVTGLRYRNLNKFMHDRFDVGSTAYHWKARDYISVDHMPIVGKPWIWSRHVRVATAFMKWGLTNGTTSGMLLADQISGRKNPLSRRYRPRRFFSPSSFAKVLWRGFRA